MRGIALLVLCFLLGVSAVGLLLKGSPGAQHNGQLVSVKDAQVDELDPKSVKRHIEYLEATQGELPPGVESKADFFEAYYAWMSVRLDESGRFDPSYLRPAIAHRDLMKDTPRSLSPGGIFQQVGPANISTLANNKYFGIGPLSGRKNGLAIFPGNSNIMYLATAGGGIWKTSNGGTNWSPQSDSWGMMLTSSVAVHPTNANIVLAGTGDARGFFQHYGEGIMRSADGGVTWKPVGTGNMRRSCISKIIFDTANPGVVLALATVASSSRGQGFGGAVYRSTNGGVAWSQITSFPASMEFVDIERSTGGIFYVAAVLPDGSTSGLIFKSTTVGASWTSLDPPSPAGTKLLDLACSKVANNTLFVLSCGDEKVYKSTTGGTSWVNITGNFQNGANGVGANYNWSQKDYDAHISTSRNGNTDVIYVGLIGLQVNLTGGTSWIDIGKSFTPNPPYLLHNDQHFAVPDPNNPAIVFIGCDGGIFEWLLTNPNTGAGVLTSLNLNIKDHQLYHLSVHPSDPTRVIAGMQDNANAASRGNWGAWTGLAGGDGSWSAFDKANPAIHYTSSQFGFVERYTANTNTGTVIKPNNAPQGEFGFIAPLVTGGPNGSAVFMAGANLWRWQGGNTWIQKNMFTGPGAPASELAVAPLNGNVIYSGNPTGAIVRTGDGGDNWARIDDVNIDFRPIGALAVRPTNSNDVIAGLQGAGSYPRLWRCVDTTIGSPAWSNISGSGASALPPAPVNAIAFDPNNVSILYVGTDVGAFMTTNSGSTWTRMTGLGLPNVAVTHMAVDGTKNWLYVATFGRGAWRLPLVAAASYSVSGNLKQGASNLAGLTVQLESFKENTQTFIASPNIVIPDNNLTGITTNLNLSLDQRLTRMVLYLNIQHNFVGDLKIDLQGPSGIERTVRDRVGGSQANLTGFFEVPGFEDHATKGIWRLKVKDLAGGDEGKLVQWRLVPYYMAYSSAATPATTNASGNYTFAALPAGQYQVKPVQAGRTFTPPLQQFNLGPNATGKNFQRVP